MIYAAYTVAGFIVGFWTAIGFMCWLGRRSQARAITTAHKSREELRGTSPQVVVFLPKTDGMN